MPRQLCCGVRRRRFTNYYENEFGYLCDVDVLILHKIYFDNTEISENYAYLTLSPRRMLQT
jgi:hypothetical protein